MTTVPHLCHREWDGKKLDNSMLREGMQSLASLSQDQVDSVIEALREQKKGRRLYELTTDLMLMLLQARHVTITCKLCIALYSSKKTHSAF